ncbi:MAG: hypothetical protein J5I65_06870 [Aridibacter famidurans]|nr:hypothetical protein [Aridibacter famidurans]
MEIAAPGQFVGHVSYGWPFVYYISTDFGGHYYLPGLIGNFLFAASFGAVVGFLCAYFWKKIAVNNLGES